MFSVKQIGFTWFILAICKGDNFWVTFFWFHTHEAPFWKGFNRQHFFSLRAGPFLEGDKIVQTEYLPAEGVSFPLNVDKHLNSKRTDDNNYFILKLPFPFQSNVIPLAPVHSIRCIVSCVIIQNTLGAMFLILKRIINNTKVLRVCLMP